MRFHYKALPYRSRKWHSAFHARWSIERDAPAWQSSRALFYIDDMKNIKQIITALSIRSGNRLS